MFPLKLVIIMVKWLKLPRCSDISSFSFVVICSYLKWNFSKNEQAKIKKLIGLVNYCHFSLVGLIIGQGATGLNRVFLGLLPFCMDRFLYPFWGR